MKNAFFIILLLLFGCTPKETEIPPGVLSHQEMVRVLIDVHILESKVKKLYIGYDSSQAVYRHYEQMMFDERGISRETYEQSLEYYVGEIEQLREIYEEVADSLLARSKSEDIN